MPISIRGRINPIKPDDRINAFDPMDTGDTDRIAPLPFAFIQGVTDGDGGGNGGGGGGGGGGCPDPMATLVQICPPDATIVPA